MATKELYSDGFTFVVTAQGFELRASFMAANVYFNATS